MRSRAEAANEGPWAPETNHSGYHQDIWSELGAGRRFQLGGDFVPPDAEHIASWHPAVALAVADWLDSVADRDGTCRSVESEPALAVADAYLNVAGAG